MKFGTLLVIKRDGNHGSKFPILADVTIGSDAGADVKLKVENVADRQCKITTDADSKKLLLQVLDKDYVTILDGKKLNPGKSVEIQDGATLMVADRRFRIFYPDSILEKKMREPVEKTPKPRGRRSIFDKTPPSTQKLPLSEMATPVASRNVSALATPSVNFKSSPMLPKSILSAKKNLLVTRTPTMSPKVVRWGADKFKSPEGSTPKIGSKPSGLAQNSPKSKRRSIGPDEDDTFKKLVTEKIHQRRKSSSVLPEPTNSSLLMEIPETPEADRSKLKTTRASLPTTPTRSLEKDGTQGGSQDKDETPTKSTPKPRKLSQASSQGSPNTSKISTSSSGRRSRLSAQIFKVSPIHLDSKVSKSPRISAASVASSRRSSRSTSSFKASPLLTSVLKSSVVSTPIGDKESDSFGSLSISDVDMSIFDKSATSEKRRSSIKSRTSTSSNSSVLPKSPKTASLTSDPNEESEKVPEELPTIPDMNPAKKTWSGVLQSSIASGSPFKVSKRKSRRKSMSRLLSKEQKAVLMTSTVNEIIAASSTGHALSPATIVIDKQRRSHRRVSEIVEKSLDSNVSMTAGVDQDLFVSPLNTPCRDSDVALRTRKFVDRIRVPNKSPGGNYSANLSGIAAMLNPEEDNLDEEEVEGDEEEVEDDEEEIGGDEEEAEGDEEEVEGDEEEVEGDEEEVEGDGKDGDEAQEETPELTVAKKTSPKAAKSPVNNLDRSFRGVARVLRTPEVVKSPGNNLDRSFRGVAKLMKSPGQMKSPPNNLDLTLGGVKKLVASPVVVKSPRNNLDISMVGVRKIVRTPKAQNSPKNDLDISMRGVKKLVRTPKNQKSPVNDLDRSFRGVKNLVGTPKQAKSPVNDLSCDFKGTKRLLDVPQKRRSSIACPDNSVLESVPKLLMTPPVKRKSEVRVASTSKRPKVTRKATKTTRGRAKPQEEEEQKQEELNEDVEDVPEVVEEEAKAPKKRRAAGKRKSEEVVETPPKRTRRAPAKKVMEEAEVIVEEETSEEVVKPKRVPRTPRKQVEKVEPVATPRKQVEKVEPVATPGRRTRKKQVEEEAETEKETIVEKKKPVKRTKKQEKEEVKIEEEAEKPKKAAPKKRAPRKKVAFEEEVTEVDQEAPSSQETVEDEPESSKTVKKTAARRGRKAKVVEEPVEEPVEEEAPSGKKKAAVKKPAKKAAAPSKAAATKKAGAKEKKETPPVRSLRSRK